MNIGQLKEILNNCSLSDEATIKIERVNPENDDETVTYYPTDSVSQTKFLSCSDTIKTEEFTFFITD